MPRRSGKKVGQQCVVLSVSTWNMGRQLGLLPFQKPIDVGQAMPIPKKIANQYRNTRRERRVPEAPIPLKKKA